MDWNLWRWWLLLLLLMLVVLLLGVSFLHVYQSFMVGRKAFGSEDLSGGVAIIIRLMGVTQETGIK